MRLSGSVSMTCETRVSYLGTHAGSVAEREGAGYLTSSLPGLLNTCKPILSQLLQVGEVNLAVTGKIGSATATPEAAVSSAPV